MIGTMRNRMGKFVVYAIIIAICIVMAFFGAPGGKGGVSPGLAGTVGGESISLAEFNRAYQQRIQMFKNLNLSEEQVKRLGIKKSVWQELVNRKLMVIEAERLKLEPSSEEIRSQVLEMEYFKQDGRFSKTKYRNVLKANNYSPASFEQLIRQDLMAQNWQKHLSQIVKVANNEISDEYLIRNNKRKINYVVLNQRSGQKGITISPKEIKDYLADESKMNLVKSRFEAGKTNKFKGKKLEQVQNEIASDLIAGTKTEEINKFNADLAEKVAKAFGPSKADEKKVNAMLKNYDVKVRNSAWLTKKSSFVPGINDSSELLKDLFSGNQTSKKAKIYKGAGWVAVAVVTESESADLAKLDEKAKKELRQSLETEKLADLRQSELKRLSTEVEIEANPTVVN